MTKLLDLPDELLLRIITVAWIFPFHPNVDPDQFRDACMLVNKRWACLSKWVFKTYLNLSKYQDYKALCTRAFYQPDDAQMCTTLIFILTLDLCWRETSESEAYIHPCHFPQSNFPNLKTIIIEIKLTYWGRYEPTWGWIRRLPYQIDTLVLQFTFFVEDIYRDESSPETSGWGKYQTYEMEEIDKVQPNLVAPGIKNLEMHNTKGNEEMLAYLVDLFPNLEHATSDGVSFDIWALPQIDVLKVFEAYSEFLRGMEYRLKYQCLLE